MKLQFKHLLILFCCLCLAACGFQLRSSEELPPQLHELCIITPKPESSFSYKLNRMFSSLGTIIDKSCRNAPYQLQIYNTRLTRDNPTITTADQALTFNYTYSIDLDLKNQLGQSIISRRILVATRPVILNAQQVYTSYNTAAIQKQLEQIILGQIFDQFSTSESKANFNKYPNP